MLDEKMSMQRENCFRDNFTISNRSQQLGYIDWRVVAVVDDGGLTQTKSSLNFFPVTPNLVEQHNWSQTNSLSLLIHTETQLAYSTTLVISSSSSSSCTESYTHSLTSPCLRWPDIHQQPQLNYKVSQIELWNNSSTFWGKIRCFHRPWVVTCLVQPFNLLS